ncbi:MAG: hypothetical protein Q9174_000572 [Haloplaca sp. 1 TL-2023]
MADWRYLFLIEGCCTILFSCFAFFYLPHSAATAKFLSPGEKHLAYYRMQIDSSSVVNEKFNLRESFKIFKEWTSWLILAIEICLGVPLQSVQLFLPQIVARLGFGAVKTNLYTVAPNVSGAAMLLILAFASDCTRWRFPFVALGFLFTFLGMIVYVGIDVQTPKYIPALATTAAFGGTGFALTLLLGGFMIFDNARRNLKAGRKVMVKDIPTE